jgi:hypothetical protein
MGETFNQTGALTNVPANSLQALNARRLLLRVFFGQAKAKNLVCF